MAHDALGAHARDELGIHELTRARPIQAALASAASFVAGAAPPALLVALLPTGILTAGVVIVTLGLLLGLGGLAARLGGAGLARGALRVAFWGAVAMAGTALVGRLFGAAVEGYCSREVTMRPSPRARGRRAASRRLLRRTSAGHPGPGPGPGSGSSGLPRLHRPRRRPQRRGRMIPVETPQGTFRVWTKRVGNNPRVKVLLLHGGPGVTHEYFEAFDSWLPAAGIEYYYYDQLGSYYSDQPDDPSCGSCRASSTRSSRSGRRSASTRTTSSCSASRGAGSSRWSTPSSTSST